MDDIWREKVFRIMPGEIFDLTELEENESQMNNVLQQQYGGTIESIDLYYDIDVTMKNDKSDFDQIENLEELIAI